MDYYMGTHPLFEVFKVLRRLGSKPLLVGALARLSGFIGAYCRRDERQVPPEFMAFIRREQMRRLWGRFQVKSPRIDPHPLANGQ